MKNIPGNILFLIIISFTIISCNNKKIQNNKDNVLVEPSEVEINSSLFELKNPPMNNQDILNLQERLLSLGFSEIGNADGYYGQLTAEVIKTIQYFSGFEQNKIVDKKLWNFIFNESNNTILKNINIVSKYNINELRKATERRMGYSNEGGGIEKYFSGNEIKIIKLNILGETFKCAYYLYYINSNYYFIIEGNYKYPFPIYYYNLDPNKLDATEREIYADELEIVARGEFWTKGFTEFNTYIKNNKSLLQIKDGILFETDFFLDDLIKIIEDEKANWY